MIMSKVGHASALKTWRDLTTEKAEDTEGNTRVESLMPFRLYKCIPLAFRPFPSLLRKEVFICVY